MSKCAKNLKEIYDFLGKKPRPVIFRLNKKIVPHVCAPIHFTHDSGILMRKAAF